VATILVGSLAGSTSPARHDTDLLGVELALRGPVEIPLEPIHEHGLVVLEGGLRVDGTRIAPDELAFLGGGRQSLSLIPDDPTRALLLGGAPFESPILMWWNFVGRTRQDIEVAWRDWQAGAPRFGPVASTLERIGAPRPSWLGGASPER
jgi:quercetin 2,3-dioxygenase